MRAALSAAPAWYRLPRTCARCGRPAPSAARTHPSADAGSGKRSQACTEVGTEVGRGRGWSARSLPKGLESPGNAVYFHF